MRTIARFMDARNTAEGKFLSVLLSVLLVFSFLNVTMFTDYAGADPNEASEENSLPVEEPEFTEPEATAEEPKAEEASEEVTTPAPVEQKQETTVEKEPVATDVEVELQLTDATIVYDGAEYGDNDNLVAPLGEDLEFSVKAAEGAEVKVAATIGDEDVVLSPEADGNYILKGDRVTDALAVIGVVAEIPEADQADEPAATSEPPAQKAFAEEGTSPAAEDAADAKTIYVGESIVLQGEEGWGTSTAWHSWSVSPSSLASISKDGKNGSKATLKPTAEGHITVTHSYSNGWGQETFTYNVVARDNGAAPADDMTRIYVYTKLAGDTSGWTLNKDGWFTLGYIDVPARLLGSAATTDDWPDVDVTDYLGSIVRHSDNEAINFYFDDINWDTTVNEIRYGLHKANGASGYDDDDKTWHLDGYLEVQARYTLNIDYKYMDGSEAAESYSDVTLKSGSEYSVESPEISGYHPDRAVVEGTIVSRDEIETVTYYPDNVKYTVQYFYEEDGQYSQVPDGADEVTLDSSAATSPLTATATEEQKTPTRNGYAFDKDAQNILTKEITWDGSTVLKVYFKKIAAITLAAATETVTYDGEPHYGKWSDGVEVVLSVPGVLETGPALKVTADDGKTYYVAGYGLTLSGDKLNAAGEAVEVGEYTVTPTGENVTVYDEQGRVVDPRYYSISVNPGKLTITKSEIAKYVTLTPADVVKTYDGTAYTAGVATATDSNGKDVKVEYSVDGENWTTDPTSITATAVADSVTVQVRASVESSYQGYVTGTQKLTINEREVTVAGDGWASEQPYTGTEYSKDTYTFGNVAGGQTAAITYSISGTEVGTYAGEFGEDFKVMAGDVDVTANYKLTEKTPGKLTIKRQSIEPTIPGEPDPENPDEPVNPVPNPDYGGVTVGQLANVVYNGRSQAQIPELLTADRTPLGVNDYKITFSEDTVNANTVTVVVEGIGNYSGKVIRTYQILPRTVNLSSASASKPYDGTALTRPDVEVGGDGFVAGEATARATGSVTDVAEGDVTNAIEIVPGANYKEGNYSITRTEGTLRILASNENDVVIDGINGLDGRGIVKTYDGQTLTVTATAARDNSTVEYSVDGGAWTAQQPTFLNAGTYEVAVRATNPNYETVEKAVTVVVNRAPVTVAAVAASKTAGAADPALTATVSGMVNGEPASLISYTVARAAGELVGSYQIVPTGLAIQGNYAVTYVPATLTISAAPVVPPTVTPVVPTAPVVTPAAVTPAPTPAAPAAPAPAAPAPAAAPAAAAPAPATEPIEDDATPQAAAPAERTPLAETEEIEDEGTPMGAFDEPHCWVHWVMLLGILITAAYGAIVVRRRLHLADDVDDYEKQVLGIEDEAPEAVPADGRQAL